MKITCSVASLWMKPYGGTIRMRDTSLAVLFNVPFVFISRKLMFNLQEILRADLHFLSIHILVHFFCCIAFLFAFLFGFYVFFKNKN